MSRPRIRTLKPETWQDEKIGRVSRDARLLFVGLITLADDDGRFRSLPSQVLGHIYPYDQDAPRKLERWMRELTDTGLVLIYEHGGVQYGAIPTFRKHQRINRQTDSILPPPPGWVEPDPPKEASEPSAYRKKAIPERVRRAVARRHGAEPGSETTATCVYCGDEGTIRWPRLSNGKPGSWVHFDGLELDHVEPEVNGGEATANNIVLACPPCNRSKGHGNVTGFRDRTSRTPVTDGTGPVTEASA